MNQSGFDFATDAGFDFGGQATFSFESAHSRDERERRRRHEEEKRAREKREREQRQREERDRQERAKNRHSHAWEDPCEVLGVSRSATAKEIRKAWSAKMKACRPDVGGNVADAQRFNRAYEALKGRRR